MNNKEKVQTIISSARVIFWDFDGVIKDSVPVKSEAFRKLFSPFGKKVTNMVVEHHMANGGMSRYKKIPYYFKNYLGMEITKKETNQYADELSELLVDEVVNSPWIPGVEDYLCLNPYNQVFILVTGTPHQEMESILEKLGLGNVFSTVHGSPEEKTDSIAKELRKNGWKASNCILIGDSSIDYKAAKGNNIKFIYRGEKNILYNLDSEYSINDFMQVISHV